MAADPKNTNRLRIGQEYDCIQESISRSKYRDHWELSGPKFSLQPCNLSGLLIEHSSHLVHFSGHGEKRRIINSSVRSLRKIGENIRKVALHCEEKNDHESYAGGIVLEDSLGNAKLVNSNALRKMFSCFSGQIACVVLNACNTLDQAKAIVSDIPFAIGMRKEIQDQAAIAFSDGFYKALAGRCSIEKAYKIGCAQIGINSIQGDSTPALLINPKISDFAIQMPYHLSFLFEHESKSDKSKNKRQVVKFTFTFRTDEKDSEDLKNIDIKEKIGENTELTIIDFEIKTEEDRLDSEEDLDDSSQEKDLDDSSQEEDLDD